MLTPTHPHPEELGGPQAPSRPPLPSLWGHTTGHPHPGPSGRPKSSSGLWFNPASVKRQFRHERRKQDRLLSRCKVSRTRLLWVPGGTGPSACPGVVWPHSACSPSGGHQLLLAGACVEAALQQRQKAGQASPVRGACLRHVCMRVHACAGVPGCV